MLLLENNNRESVREAIEAFAESMNKGKEPMLQFKDTKDLDGWSNIPDYEKMLLVELSFLSKEFCEWDDENGIHHVDPIIESNIINKDLKYGLSVNGYARGQMLDAHRNLWDLLKPQIAGLPPINNDASSSVKR